MNSDTRYLKLELRRYNGADPRDRFMNSDTRYLKLELRRYNDPDRCHGVQGLMPLRTFAWVWARSPSGSKLQRVALAWLRRKSPASAAEYAQQSQESDASLARKAAAL